MKPRLVAMLLSLAALTPAAAQEKPGVVCPVVYVSCPDVPSRELPVTYTATVSGGDPSVVPTFKWTVSQGRITRGQGTRVIEADTEGRDTQTATVEVGGYPATCPTTNSCSWIVCATSARKMDEFGPKTSLGDEKARLAYFAQELQNDPTATGYVVAYAGRRARAGEARAAGERVRRYLVNVWGIEAARVVAVDGGHREDRSVELFMAPAGALPPTLTPTVEPAEVKIIKSARQSKHKGRRGTQRARR